MYPYSSQLPNSSLTHITVAFNTAAMATSKNRVRAKDSLASSCTSLLAQTIIFKQESRVLGLRDGKLIPIALSFQEQGNFTIRQ